MEETVSCFIVDGDGWNKMDEKGEGMVTEDGKLWTAGTADRSGKKVDAAAGERTENDGGRGWPAWDGDWNRNNSELGGALKTEDGKR